MLYLNYDHRAYSSRCMCCSRWRRIPNRNESVNLKNIFSLQEPEIEMKVHFWNLKSSLNPLLQECHGHHNLNMTFLFSYQPRPRTMQINTPYMNSLDSSKTPFATHMGALPWVSHTLFPLGWSSWRGDLKQVQFPSTMWTTQFIQHPP